MKRSKLSFKKRVTLLRTKIRFFVGKILCWAFGHQKDIGINYCKLVIIEFCPRCSKIQKVHHAAKA